MILMTDIITKQIRDRRHQLAEQFDNDLDRIVADLKARQQESDHKMVDRSGMANSPDNKAMNSEPPTAPMGDG